MNPKEKLKEMLSLNKYGKGCNNDELICLFEDQAKEIIRDFQREVALMRKHKLITFVAQNFFMNITLKLKKKWCKE